MHRIEKLKSDLNKLETVFQTPRIFLADHFDALRNQIDLECEKYLKEENYAQTERKMQAIDFQSQMLDHVKSYEQKCFSNLPLNKLVNDELNESITGRLDQLKIHVNDSALLTKTEAEISEVNEIVLETLNNIQKFLFMNKEMILLTNECPLVKDIEARIESDFNVYQFKIIKSFGVLLIIQDEFIGIEAILKSSEIKYGEARTNTSFKITDLMFHFLKIDLQSHLTNPIHFTELKLNKKNSWDLQFQKIKELSLANHVIQNQFIYLSSINLSSNNLTTLDPNTFQGLHNLETLYLRHNRFTTLDPNIFKGLSSLKHLYLDHNKLTHVKMNVFSDLTSLKTLNLNYTELDSLELGIFDELYNLKRLFLGYGKLTKLDNNVFADLKNLEKLHLNHNKLVKINHNVFRSLSNLKFLHLNNNQLGALEPGLFQGLANLEKLCLNENCLTELESPIFKELRALKTIYLDRNQLGYVDSNLFEGLFELGTLILSLNRLGSLNTFCFKDQSKLEHLLLDCNQITYFEPEILNTLKNLKTLNLKDNKISEWIQNVLAENYVKRRNQKFELSI